MVVVMMVVMVVMVMVVVVVVVPLCFVPCAGTTALSVPGELLLLFFCWSYPGPLLHHASVW